MKQIGNDPPEQFHPILWNLREFPGRVVVKQKNYLWRLGNEVSVPPLCFFRSQKQRRKKAEEDLHICDPDFYH